MIALLQRSVGRVVRPLCALVVVLIGFQIAVTAAAAAFADSGDFARLRSVAPTFLQQTLGPVLTSFAGMVMVGYFDALIVMLFVQVAIYVATEPADDIGSSLVDLLLARPIPRHWLITRSLVMMAATVIALAGAMALGSWIGLVWLAPTGVEWPTASMVLTLMVHLVAIASCFGAAALAASGWARRRGAAQAVIGVAAVALYLLDILGVMWAPVRDIARVSPFNYFRGSAILAGNATTARDLTVLGTLTLIGIATAYLAFRRRDL